MRQHVRLEHVLQATGGRLGLVLRYAKHAGEEVPDGEVAPLHLDGHPGPSSVRVTCP